MFDFFPESFHRFYVNKLCMYNSPSYVQITWFKTLWEKFEKLSTHHEYFQECLHIKSQVSKYHKNEFLRWRSDQNKLSLKFRSQIFLLWGKYRFYDFEKMFQNVRDSWDFLHNFSKYSRFFKNFKMFDIFVWDYFSKCSRFCFWDLFQKNSRFSDFHIKKNEKSIARN